ncbi:MAG: hypothetical protein ACRBK7_30495 [Acidimicrobiales bacterium]
MTEASYTAWDDKQYVWPPPEGWYQASDEKWWPEGYGPQPSTPAETQTEAASTTAATESTAAAVADSATAAVAEGTAAAAESAAAVTGSTAAAAENAATVAQDTAAEAETAVESAVADATDGQAATAVAGGVAAAAGAAGAAGAAFGALKGRAEEAVPSTASALGDKANDGIAKVSDVANDLNPTDINPADLNPTDLNPTDLNPTDLNPTDLNPADLDPTGTLDGSGAFGSAPMEMNDLSTGSAAALADRADSLAAKASDLTNVVADKADLQPDINTDIASDLDVDLGQDGPGELPTQVFDPELPGGDFDAGSLPTVDSLPDAGDVADVASGVGETQLAIELPDAPDHLAPTAESAGQALPEAEWDGAPAPDVDLWAASNGPGEAGQASNQFGAPAGFEGQSVGGAFTAVPPQGPGVDQTNPFEPAESFDPAATQVAYQQPHVGPQSQPASQPAHMAPAPSLNANPNQHGLDPQSMLDAKPKGGRSKTWLLVLLGMVLLAGICAAAYFYLQSRSDDTAADPVVASGPGSVEQPHSRDTGVVVFYPDGDVNQRWVVEVLEPVRDASAEFGGGPEAGDVFAATRVRVRNESGVDGASLSDLSFNAVNASGELINREDNQCAAAQDDLGYDASVSLGTVLEGTVCWEIPAGELDGLKLGIESSKVAGRVHIALD